MNSACVDDEPQRPLDLEVFADEECCYAAELAFDSYPLDLGQAVIPSSGYALNMGSLDYQDVLLPADEVDRTDTRLHALAHQLA